jgi:CRP/FNR family transcriptional regulator, anaerobic regulatory protein
VSDDRLLALYPAVAELPAPEREAVLATELRRAHVPAGALLFDEGAPCSGFPFVLEGAIQVSRGSQSGRSLELYRLSPGDLCVVSTACLLGRQGMSAHARTTAPTELAMLGPAGFERWAAHAAFRRFVFGMFADRLADLMALTEAVAFQRLDQRLATALLRQGGPVLLTHQALADELGSSREIVTRLLRRFETSGWVALGRERIDLCDLTALHALSTGSARD